VKISFCHYGNDGMASYRYRAAIPAAEMGAKINDPTADVIIFAKPIDQDVPYVVKAQHRGSKVIADFCDMHFHLPFYDLILKTANAVTCPTQWFADWIRETYGIEALVVPDPYEFPEVQPHCSGDKLLWFGHGLNINSLIRVVPFIKDHPLTVVSNLAGVVQWSKENLLKEMATADIVVIPETAPYKSPNRTLEAIRRGCFVVAEPHPAINDFPGIWIGNLKRGIEWAMQNQEAANTRTKLAQEYVQKWYSPATQASAWKIAIQKALDSSTSEAVTYTGTDG
jgi:hypothetical protein